MKRIFLAWLVILPLAAPGQSLPKSEFTFSAGYLFEGEVYVWAPNRYGSVGETFLLKTDYTGYFSDYFGLGGYVALGKPYYYAFEQIGMYEIGVVAKARFKAGDKFLFKLPLYIGYRNYDSSAGRGLAINLSGVLQYQGEKIKPFLDLGFLTQPAGGNEGTDMTFAPVFQASVGICF